MDALVGVGQEPLVVRPTVRLHDGHALVLGHHGWRLQLLGERDALRTITHVAADAFVADQVLL